MKRVTIAVDQSTTTTKVYLIDETGVLVDESSKAHRKYYPQPGWVEHDPVEIWDNVKTCVRDLMDRHRNEVVADSICLTNQRETVVAWDREGMPVYRAIVWQCARSNALCKAMIRQGHEPMVVAKTGLKIDPYFSATKMKWIVDHVECDTDRLHFGTMDSWLLYKLTKGAVHATDHTNASRTLLYNLSTNAWDDELCALFGINRQWLPEIRCSDEVFGTSDVDGILANPVPIRGVMGDSQAAFFAQRCTNEYDMKMTLGTGSSIMMNVSTLQPQINGLVNVLAYCLKDERAYGVEGIVNCNGESLNWACEDMDWFESYGELDDALFERKTDVLFVPALTGLSIPYWNPMAKGMFVGVDRQSEPRDFLLGVIRGVVCQLCDALACFEPTSKPIHVDGGLSKNPHIMQLLADLSGRIIEVSHHPDLSAMGAWLAGSKKKDFARETIVFEPKMALPVREAWLARYHRAIDCALMMANVKKGEREPWNESTI